jgi:hypothetical protein
MRTTITTLLTAACLACGAAGALAVENNRQGAASLRTVFDYSGPTYQSSVVPSAALSTMPVADAGYTSYLTDEAAAADATKPEGSACGDTCGCGDSCCDGSCGCNNSCWLSQYEDCSLEKLMGLECCCDWNIGGWIEMGYI